MFSIVICLYFDDIERVSGMLHNLEKMKRDQRQSILY